MTTLDFIPKNLETLKNPPSKLFYLGNKELLNYPKVAIIGSRRMSTYTKNCVLNLSSTLKRSGVVVVSGGAIGVDIYAARGAMPNTIGVFANGLDSIYPKINQKTIEELYKNGLALSEYEKGHIPRRFDFLDRNRLIIALSDVVVVAQAEPKSGSLQSARLARELKKELFVLPQRLGESSGTNDLLANNQAKLLNDFASFASSYGSLSKDASSKDVLISAINNGQNSLDTLLNEFGQRIYEYELEGKISIEGTFVRALL